MPEGRYGDGKTGFRGQKDIKNIFKVGGFKDRKTKIIGRKFEDGKTEIIKQKDEMMFFRGRGCEDRSSVAAFNCYI